MNGKYLLTIMLVVIGMVVAPLSAMEKSDTEKGVEALYSEIEEKNEDPKNVLGKFYFDVVHEHRIQLRDKKTEKPFSEYLNNLSSDKQNNPLVPRYQELLDAVVEVNGYKNFPRYKIEAGCHTAVHLKVDALIPPTGLDLLFASNEGTEAEADCTQM